MSSNTLNQLVYNFKESIDKKQRNLIKRKAKLDQYRGTLSQGQQLQADQAKALQNYEQVRSNITLLGEIIEQANDFTKKVTDEIEQLHTKKESSAQAETVSIMAREFMFRNLLRKITSDSVQESILNEYGEQKHSLIKDLARTVAFTDDLVVTPDANLDLKHTPYHDFALTMYKIVNPPNDELIKLNSKQYPFSFTETRDLLISILKNTRVQAAIEGKQYIVPEPTPVVVIEEGESSPEMVNKAEAGARFNFLHPSLVEEQPQHVIFQEVEAGQNGAQPWLNIQLNGDSVGQEKQPNGRRNNSANANRTHPPRGRMTNNTSRVYAANNRGHNGTTFGPNKQGVQQTARLTVH